MFFEYNSQQPSLFAVVARTSGRDVVQEHLGTRDWAPLNWEIVQPDYGGWSSVFLSLVQKNKNATYHCVALEKAIMQGEGEVQQGKEEDPICEGPIPSRKSQT